MEDELTEEQKAYKPITENPIRIDFRECRHYDDIFLLLKKRLGLPDFCGENWSAIWDLARGFSSDPITVELHGVSELQAKYPEDVKIMLEVFDDIHEESPHVVFVRVDSV